VTGILLEVEDLRTQFRTKRGTVHAVDGVSFSLEAGRTLGIVGESGCGKSVTALSIAGLLPPAAHVVSGVVRFNGIELTRLSRRKLQAIRGREIGMIFQDPMTGLNPTMTIGDQIGETLVVHEGLSRRDVRRRAIELLEQVHIGNAAGRIEDYPHRFSGGMRQRVMIAIAIACRPKLLIADEPTTALDVTVQAGVLDLLVELRDEYRMGMIMITHDMGVIAEIADNIAVMYGGQIVEATQAVSLFDKPEHPYTEALLGALPQLEGHDARKGRLLAIPGQPPDLVDPPQGCRFAPRCRYASMADSCATQAQHLRDLGGGHFVRTAHPTSERRTKPEVVRA
jgi:oligopeptide/dipeptide ABC transporter ATP-binding protein